MSFWRDLPKRVQGGIALTVWALGLSVGVTTAAGAAEAPPNFLVLVADDLGWNHNSVYGDAVATPNLEALADSGVVFEHAFVTAPSCSPSRISLLTGLYPHQTDAEDMHVPLPERFRIVPSYLSDAGYFTGHMRKTHYGPHAEAQFAWYDEGVDQFDGFLDAAGDAPFFLWVGFDDPHRPYDTEALEPWAVDTDRITPPRHLADAPGTRGELAAYFAEIRRLDDKIGGFVQTLEERGLSENTVVIVVSDNGAPFPREKTSLYDAGTRTPFIVSWPAIIDDRRRVEGLTSMIDFAPTILDLAGLQQPDSMEGASLAPTLRGEADQRRDYVFTQRNWHGHDAHVRAVRTKEFKLILNAYVDRPQPYGSGLRHSWWDLLALREKGELTPEQAFHFRVPRARIELYHLPSDPDEYVNVAGTPEFAATAQELAGVLARWRDETGDFPHWTRRRDDTSDRETNVWFNPMADGAPPFIDQ